MTKFTAIYNGKKTSIEGKSLWDAKQKAIKELKVPKSKEGFVSIMSDKSIANQDFRFMEKGGGVGMAEKKAIGGVLLGSAIGGYAGYKIGRARPQKSGFDTEKKIASKLKKGASKVKQDLKEGAEKRKKEKQDLKEGAEKRKKEKLAPVMAKGGEITHQEIIEWLENHPELDGYNEDGTPTDETYQDAIEEIKAERGYAEGGGVDKYVLPKNLKKKLDKVNQHLNKFGGRSLTEKEAIRFNIDNNAQSGFEAGSIAFDISEAPDEYNGLSWHRASARYYHLIGDSLIEISEEMTNVPYDSYDSEIIKQIKGTEYETYAKGGKISSKANGGWGINLKWW